LGQEWGRAGRCSRECGGMLVRLGACVFTCAPEHVRVLVRFRARVHAGGRFEAATSIPFSILDLVEYQVRLGGLVAC
jgi:hypothetical protein